MTRPLWLTHHPSLADLHIDSGYTRNKSAVKAVAAEGGRRRR